MMNPYPQKAQDSCDLLFVSSVAVLAIAFGAPCLGHDQTKYELWETAPAPNRGGDFDVVKARGYPYDHDWEYWSYPLGNGTLGANVFGRTDTERVQLSEKTFYNAGCYNRGGLTNLAELYLDFGHSGVQGYRRSLSLNDAIASVSYVHDRPVQQGCHSISAGNCRSIPCCRATLQCVR